RDPDTGSLAAATLNRGKANLPQWPGGGGWCRLQESNPRHPVYNTGALPTELSRPRRSFSWRKALGASIVRAMPNPSYVLPVILLVLSNVFMTFAWYGHLKFGSKPLWIVVIVSWGIAFFEYCLAVPAN